MDISFIGMAIQAAGLVLLAALATALAGTLPRPSARYWAVAWWAMAAALVALFVSFHAGHAGRWFQAGYFLGEYVFALYFLAGCRHAARGLELAPRVVALFVPAAAVPALLLALAPGDFSLRFGPQSLVLTATFLLAFRELWRLRGSAADGLGLRLTLVGLALLALDFGHYLPLLAWSRAAGFELPVAYSAYTSIYDLLLEVLLMFGTLALTLDSSRREAEEANRELRRAQAQLEQLARRDALTEALNRHAFHALAAARQGGGLPGSVVIVDIDDLKPVNDRFGHAAGDDAIRATASAIRSLVRADDGLFRWGGDEFLVVLPGLDAAEAQRRFEELELRLAQVELPGVGPCPLRVSVGITPLAPGDSLESAVARADALMYERKRARKEARGHSGGEAV